MITRRLTVLALVPVAAFVAATTSSPAVVGALDVEPIEIDVEIEIYDFASPDSALLVHVTGTYGGSVVVQVLDGASDVLGEQAVELDSRILEALRQAALDPALVERADAVVTGGCERGRSTSLRVRSDDTEIVNLVAHSCAPDARDVEKAIAAVVDPVLAEVFVAIALDHGPSDPAPTTVVEHAGLTVVYRFNDSSVPPEYHRSYELTVEGTAARLVVDSYGDVLHDESVVLDAALVDTLRHDAEQLTIASFPDVQGCTGGTSESLRIVVDGVVIQDADVASCGTVGDAADATLAIGGLVGPILAEFDLDRLLATG